MRTGELLCRPLRSAEVVCLQSATTLAVQAKRTPTADCTLHPSAAGLLSISALRFRAVSNGEGCAETSARSSYVQRGLGSEPALSLVA